MTLVVVPVHNQLFAMLRCVNLIVLLLLGNDLIRFADCGGRLYVDSSVFIAPGGSFVNYVIFDDQEPLTRCGLSFQTNADILPIDITKSMVPINNDSVLKNRIFSLGKNTCGFKLINSMKHDPRFFTLHAYRNASSAHSQYSFKLTFFEKANPRNETKKVSLGERYEVKCGIPRIETTCILYDPSGRKVSSGNSCSYLLERVRMEHIGIWHCDVGIVQRMLPVTEYFVLELIRREWVKTWYKEKDGLGIVGCKHMNDFVFNDINNLQPPTYCQFISPEDKLFTIKQGAATDRYTTTGTNLSDFTCQLEFALPIQPQEIGLWKCKIYGSGGFISVKNATLPEYPKKLITAIEENKPYEVSCIVPYSIDYCYIESPQKTYYYIDDVKSLSQGNCSKLLERNHQVLGKWYCHISKYGSIDDDVIEVDVRIKKKFSAVFSDVQVEIGDSPEILCKHENPLRSCRFVDPSGLKIYHLSERKSGERIVYFGRGLDFGDCGLLLKNVTSKDQGEWTCYGRELDSEIELSDITSVKIV